MITHGVLPLRVIAPDPNQPRKHLDPDKLKELAASVRESGVIQPIIVRLIPLGHAPTIDATHFIISGERRWRASQIAEKTTIPVIVRDDLSAADVLTLQIIENMQRDDLTLSETIDAVTHLVDLHDLTSAAKKLGKDKSWVSRLVGVRNLWPPARELIALGHLQSVDAAHDLHALKDIDLGRAQQLVKEFTVPPEWRATPPTRDLIRHELERARQAVHERESQRRETEETKDARREETAANREAQGAALTKALSSHKKITPFEQGRLEQQQARDAAQKRAEALALPLYQRLADALKLTISDQSFFDADGEERYIDIDPPDDGALTADQLRTYDHKLDLWRVVVDLRYTEIITLLDALEGKASAAALPPRFQSVRQFLEATTKPCAGESIKSEWLFAHYSKWCKKQKREALEAANEFASAMEICGIKKTRRNTGRYWLDIKPVAA